MKKILIAGLVLLGICLITFPSIRNFSSQNIQEPKAITNPAPVKEQEPKAITNSVPDKEQELKLKQSTLRNDVETTRLLQQQNNHKKMDRAMNLLNQKKTDQQRYQYLQTLKKRNPFITYLEWTDAKTQKKITIGSLNPNNKHQKSLLNQAKDHLKTHQFYESSTPQDKNMQHYVIGATHQKSTSQTAVAVIDMKLLQDIRNHQNRNLRLVPYPQEKGARIKAADADSLHRIQVKKGEENEGASHYYENEIAVRFRNDPTKDQLARIQSDIHCRHSRKLGYTYVFRSHQMDMNALTKYFSKYNPIYIEPHYLYVTNEETITNNDNFTPEIIVPNDELYSRYQWNLPLTKTNQGWNYSKGSEQIIVAVVDTGVDLTHSDLKNQLLPGYNAINPKSSPQDDVGHGTHVAGIIGAQVNNGEGIAGMSWHNKLLPVKVMDKSGTGTTYSVAEGIIWATDHGAKVINLSLGNYADGQFLHDAIKYAYDHDVVLVAATGNDNTERPGYPAAYPEVFAVSAIDQWESKASYSNYGEYVDVVAPGTTIASTYTNNQYAALSGTSMACPHVAALAALIRSQNPQLRNTEVMDRIRNSTVDLGIPGKDIYFGFGEIDVSKALQTTNINEATRSFSPPSLLRYIQESFYRFHRR